MLWPLAIWWTHTCVICLLSWLPRMMTTLFGHRTLSATTMHTVSTL
jgi:hypothetical protein